MTVSAIVGPSPGAVSLIVGMAVATWVFILGVLWYFARRFLDQQTANHKDTLEALTLARRIDRHMPRISKRVRRLERDQRRHRTNHADKRFSTR